MRPAKALILVGSPRGSRSVSLALARRLARGLEAASWQVEFMDLYRLARTGQGTATLLSAVEKSELLVLAFPLYVDQLPALVVRALESIAENGRGKVASPKPGLTAIVQCGFPETLQTRPALDICRRFAELSGFEWRGGLGLGMGGAVAGRMPDRPKGMLRNVVLALDQAAAALARGEEIPPAAVELAARKFMPLRLYFLAANWGWRMQARKLSRELGKKIDLCAKPDAES